MTLFICDRCGKQIDRFVHVSKYDIRRDGKEYGFGKDRARRKYADDPQAMYRENLHFCEPCEEAIAKLLDIELSNFPKEVTLSTEL